MAADRMTADRVTTDGSAPTSPATERTPGFDVRSLDALDRRPLARSPRWRRGVGGVLPPVIAVSLAVLAWQVVVWMQLKPAFVLPGPVAVLDSFTTELTSGRVGQAVYGSLHRAVVGFALSLAIATPLGVAVGRVAYLRRALGPLLSGLQSLPSVAWVPAAILWFGSSPAAIYFVVLLGAVPSIANATIAGLDQVPPLQMRAGRVLGARGLTMARFILLPAALPTYLAGLEQGWAFAWRSLMAAELITRSPALGLGLGQELDNGRELNDPALVIASILMILFVGILVDVLAFAPVRRRTLRRRGLVTT